MNTRRTTTSKRRPSICTTSIAAFLAAAGLSSGVSYNVDLGDQLVEGTLLSGAADVQKTGLGALFLTNAGNTYGGGTVIEAGSIVITNAGALGSGPVNVLGNVTTGSNSGQLLIGGTYATQAFALPSTSIAGGGPSGNGLALMSVGNNNISGGITTSSTVATRLGSTFGMMSINGLVLGAGQSTILTGGGVANNALTGISGTGTLQKQGGNTLILTGTNTNTGIVDLNGGFVRISAAGNTGASTAGNAINFNNATLEVRSEGADLAFNTGANFRGVSLATNNGTMNLDRAVGGSGVGNTVTFGNLTLAANRNFTVNSRNGYGVQFGTGVGGAAGQNTITNNGNGPVIFTGNVWNNNDGTARVLTLAAANANSDIVINGSITAPNTVAHNVVKTGTGTLTILGVGSTYSGPTDIQNGTVTVRNLRSIGTATVAANILLGNAGNTGTLNIIGAAGSGAFTPPDASAARNIILNGAAGGGRINANQVGSAPTAVVLAGNITATSANTNAKTLTLGGASTLDNEITGVISQGSANVVSVTKVDPGSWTLSGTNTYTGATTIQNGTLKLKANAAVSTIISDAGAITFTNDGAQNAGGRLEFIGQAATANVETLGVLTPTTGAGTVVLTPGAGGSASLVFSSLAGAGATLPSGLNFVAPVGNTVTITAQPTGFVRSNVYYNGADFAYSAGGVLRAPAYGDGVGGGGTDIGFFNTAAGPLSAGLHNRVDGSFAQADITVSSLKITAGNTLTLTGLLQINQGSSTAGGIVMAGGGTATITGGNVSQGLNQIVAGGGSLVIGVDTGGTLDLASAISIGTNSTTGGLTKNGAGTLVLSGNNLQVGATNINEGTVRLSGTGRLSGASQGLLVRQGATLDLNGVGTGTAIGAFNGGGSVTNTGAAAALTVGGGNGTGTFSGVISGPLGIIKQGTGAQTWSGLNTYTGSTMINSTGIVSIPNLSNIGQPSGLGAGDATSNATNAGSLLFGGASVTGGMGGISYTGLDSVSTDRLFTFAGGAAGSGGRIQANGSNNATVMFTNTAPIAYSGAGATAAQNLVLGGASTGDNQMNVQLVNNAASLGVQKVDAGTWVLGNSGNTYTGTTTISGGRLVAVDGLSLPTGSPLVLANGVFQSNGSFNRALNATPTAGSGGVHWASTQGAVGGGFAADSAKLTVNLGPGAALTWGNGGFLSAIGSAAASSVLILNSTTALAEVEFQNSIDLGTASRTIQVDDNGTTTTDFATLSGAISGAGVGITKTGAGSLQLLGANTYTGPTTLTTGTVYVTSVNGNLGDASSQVNFNGGTLNYVGAGETSPRVINVPVNATIDASGSGALVLSGVTFNGTTGRTLTLTGSNTDANEVSNALTNAGTSVLTVTKAGAGTWILSNPGNTYTGTTSVTSGALGIGSNTALGTGTLALTNGAIFADGGDRTIANTLTGNNATGAVTGVNSLTVGTFAFGVGGNFTLNNNLASTEEFTVTGSLTNGEIGTLARTIAFGGTGRTVISGIFSDGGTGAPAVSALTQNSGTLVLGGASPNTYSGNTTINGGTFRLAGGSGNSVPDGAGKGNVTIGNTAIPVVFDVNGMTETINGLTGTTTGAKTIDNSAGSAATLTVGNNNGPVNFNGSITQTGGFPLSIVKTGTAAGVLSGSAFSYTGSTEVQTGGSLAFPNAQPSTTAGITVAGGAGLSFINGVGTPVTGGGAATLNLGAGGGTTLLGLDLGTTSDTLTVGGAATTAGGSTVSFGLNGVAGFGAGTYNLLSATGGSLLGPTYTLSSIPGGFSYVINQSANLISLTATANAAGFFYWRGDLSNSWSAISGTNTNWEDAGGTDTGSTPGPLDTVYFSSLITPPAGGNVVTTLDGNSTIDQIEFNGATTTAGTAGVVAITQGAIGTLTIKPAFSTNGILIPDGGGVASITAPVELGSDQTWTVGTNGTPLPQLFATGVLSGTGNLTKAGLGTVTITGANTRTGKTTINAGTLRINAEAALGVNPGAPTADQLTLNGGTLRTTAALQINDANRGITVGISGGSIDTTGGSAAVGVSITGPGTLTKLAANLLSLEVANSYAGGTVINGGTVRAGTNTSLSAGGVTLNGSGTVLEIVDGLNLPNPITIDDANNQKTLQLIAGATTGEFSGPIANNESIGGNFRVNVGAGGTLTVSGVITSAPATGAGIRKEGAGTAILTNAGSALLGPSSVAAGILRHGPGVSNIMAANTAVTVHGTGGVAATYDLNGNNQTVSTITFNAGGGAAGSVNSVITGAGTLRLGGNVTVNNNGNPTTPALLSGNVALTATRTFTVNNSTGSVVDMLLSANVSSDSGTAASGITKAGLGTLELTGTNTYTGTTSITAGVLRNGANDVIPGALTVNAGLTSTTANYDLNGFNEAVGTLTFGGTSTVATAVNSVSGAGTLTLEGNVTSNASSATPNIQAVIASNLAMAATRTFTVADATSQGADLLVSSVIAGAGGLTKAGPGTMVLSGASTYGGVTTVNAGTLLVDGSITGSVTLGGGTLGGIGTTGPVDAGTGTIAPGDSIGTLNAGSLTMPATSTFALEINTSTLGTDLLNSTGPLTLNLANLTVTDLGLNVPLALGQRFTFINYNGGPVGQFSVGGVPIVDDTTLFTVGANQFTIDYNTANSVALVVVPEPGIAATLLGGFGMLVGLQRIRRRGDRRA